ncbi:MAG: DUF2877 domain-containing protein, partial [Thermoleophilaceae bacterium]
MAPLVKGAVRAARVVGVATRAAYLQVGGPDGALVALVTHDAVRVPNAVVILPRRGQAPFAAVRPGMVATMGGGRIRAGQLQVAVAGTWAPGQPRFTQRARACTRAGELAALIASTVPALPSYLSASVSRFADALAPADIVAVEHAVLGLLGLGPGLTPSGDDIIAGALVTLRAIAGASPALAVRADAVAQTVVSLAPGRTALVSADLLGHAAAGRCVPQLAALLAALDREGSLDASLCALLSVGHSSGGDLARGVSIALSAARGSLQTHGEPSSS